MDLIFRSEGDGYVMVAPDHGVEFHVQRLRWQGDDLKGELAVHCGYVEGRAIDGCLSRGTFNFSSPHARDQHGQLLARRSHASKLPWSDWLEALYEHITHDLRHGLPGVLLRDVPEPGPEVEHNINGWRIPANDPTIVFGDPEAGKSLLAIYLAGTLAASGVSTILVDFEWNASPHRGRLGRFFPGALPPVHYVRLDRPLIYETERLRGYVDEHRIRYAVLDSVGYGCHGKPEDAEVALAYFRALRPLGIGTLHLAHVTKPSKGETTADRDQSTQRPFGSNFWHASARSTWYVKRTDPDAAAPNAPLTLGLFHRKSNSGARHPAVGLQFTFSPERIDVRRVDLAHVTELGAKLPAWQRMIAVLRTGAQPVNRLAETLEVSEATIRQVLSRDAKKTFYRTETG
jgi:hypothetical protein